MIGRLRQNSDASSPLELVGITTLDYATSRITATVDALSASTGY